MNLTAYIHAIFSTKLAYTTKGDKIDYSVEMSNMEVLAGAHEVNSNTFIT